MRAKRLAAEKITALTLVATAMPLTASAGLAVLMNHQPEQAEARKPERALALSVFSLGLILTNPGASSRDDYLSFSSGKGEGKEKGIINSQRIGKR